MMRIYYDNVIVSGRIVEDLGLTEVAAVQTIERAHELGVIKRVTSREAWREQEGAPEPLHSTLHAARGDLSVVASDHVVLGAAAIDGLRHVRDHSASDGYCRSGAVQRPQGARAS